MDGRCGLKRGLALAFGVLRRNGLHFLLDGQNAGIEMALEKDCPLHQQRQLIQFRLGFHELADLLKLGQRFFEACRRGFDVCEGELVWGHWSAP